MARQIVVRCPKCSQKYRVSPDKIGARARCKCGQRFRIASDQPLDEETVLGWVIEGADPSSRSVLGSTSIIESPSAHQSDQQVRRPAARQTQATTNKPAQRVKLDGIDELGAHFEFSASTLADEGFRDSFPRHCVSCSRSRSLNVHLIVWYEKLPADDPLRIREINHQPIGRWQSFSGYGHTSWLAELPKLKNLDEPFCWPFPFFVCSDCTVQDEVIASLFSTQDTEYCHLCIANLRIAITFFRNNGGSDSAEYEHLLREYEKQKKDRWRSLPVAVRRQISQWCKLKEHEEFRGFFPDADFGRTERGKAGVVLTNKHIAFRKYSSLREFSLSRGGKIYLKPDHNNTVLRIVQAGRKDATVHLESSQAEQLLGELRRSGQPWRVSGQARTN